MLAHLIAAALLQQPAADEEWALVRWMLPSPAIQRGADMWYRRPVRTVSPKGPVLEFEGLTIHEFGPEGSVTRHVRYREQIDCTTKRMRSLSADGKPDRRWTPAPPEFSPPYELIQAICADRSDATAPSADAALAHSGELERKHRARVKAEQERWR